MKNRIMNILFTFTVIICTLTACSVLMGSVIKTKDIKGRMAAQVELDGLMLSVETGVLDLKVLSDAEYIAIAHTVCELVDRIGRVTKAAHYFRNCFERAPGTLNEMMTIIRNQRGGTFGWKLMSRQSTRFHMFGKNGAYNMKFISADGHFEVIYNINGIKLTEKNDPINMGTFNYGDPANRKLRHTVYDIIPFFEWGNSQKSADQVNGLSDSPPTITHNDSVTKRFEKYWELSYGRKTQKMSANGLDRTNMLYFCVALLLLSKAITATTGNKYTHTAL